jgi:hypothetical protein
LSKESGRAHRQKQRQQQRADRHRSKESSSVGLSQAKRKKFKKQLFKDERAPFVVEIDEETDVDISAAVEDFDPPIGFDFVNLPLVPGCRMVPTGDGRMVTLFKRVKLNSLSKNKTATMGERLDNLFKHEYLRLCFAVREMARCQVTSITHSLNILEDDVVELLVGAMVHRVMPPTNALFLRTRSALLATSSATNAEAIIPPRLWSAGNVPVYSAGPLEEGSISARTSGTPAGLPKNRLTSIKESKSGLGIAESELLAELNCSHSDEDSALGSHDSEFAAPSHLSVNIPPQAEVSSGLTLSPGSSSEKGGWTPRDIREDREALFDRERYESLMDQNDRRYAKRRLGGVQDDCVDDDASFNSVNVDTPLEELYHETGFFTHLRRQTRSISITRNTSENFGGSSLGSNVKQTGSPGGFDNGIKAPSTFGGSTSGPPAVPVGVVEAYNSSVRQHMATHSGGTVVAAADYNRQECASEVAITAHVEVPDAM